MIVFKKSTFQTISIVAVLALLVLASPDIYLAYLKFLLPPKKTMIDINFSEISKALEEFRKKCGAYPTTSQGLDLLRYDPEKICKDYPKNGFLYEQKPVLNPWRKNYSYESSGKTYQLYTYNDDLKESDPGYKIIFNKNDDPILTPYGNNFVKKDKIEKAYNFEYQRLTDDKGNIQFRIVSLKNRSNLSNVGIKAGDRITKINNNPVTTFKEIEDADMSIGFVNKFRISYLQSNDIYETIIDINGKK